MRGDHIAYAVAAVCLLGGATLGGVAYINQKDSEKRIARELEEQRGREEAAAKEEAKADLERRRAARQTKIKNARDAGLTTMQSYATEPWEMIAATGLDREDDPARRGMLGPFVVAWALKKLTWAHVTDESIDETTVGEASKDQRAETGKRFCSKMNVERIEAKNTEAGKGYIAFGLVDGKNVLLFAVGDTKGVVNGESAKFCSLFLYKDDTTGYFVGLFDTEMNRTNSTFGR